MVIEPVLIPLRIAALRAGYSPERLLRLVIARAVVGEKIGARWYVDAESARQLQARRAVSVHVGPRVAAGGLR